MIENKDTPNLLYSEQVDGIIWRMKLDDTTQMMAWECRDKEKKVSFYAYDFKNEKSILKNHRFEEDWLLGLEGIDDGMMFLHGYENESSPVHKGVLAFDLAQKKMVWQNFSISIQELTADGLMVFDPKIFPRKFQWLDLKTGTSISKIEANVLRNLPSIHQQILLPQILKADDPELEQQLLYKDLLIKSKFIKQADEGFQKLEIFKNQELIFQDYLNRNIQKPGFDTFFVWLDKLVYIRNKSEIVTYSL